MRKYLATLILIILIFSCTACRNNNSDSKNFLGGYGKLTQGAYADAYISAFFEDDIYIYFDNYKINKQSGQWINLCDLPGCRHNNPECLTYKYRNKIFPGYDRIFYAEGKTLYEIDEKGNTEYIAAFDTNSQGIFLSENIYIEMVKPLNHDVVYIMCQDGSCLYNIRTKQKLYTAAYMCCASDSDIYYYDAQLNGIVRADAETMQTEFLENTETLYPCFCADNKLYCNTETGIICCMDRAGNIEVCLSKEGMRYILLGIHNDRIYYLLTDMNIMTGEYTYCDLYSSMSDGTNNSKINRQDLKPDMSGFFCENALYLLETETFGGVKSVYIYDFNTDTESTYRIQGDTDNEPDAVSTEAAPDTTEPDGTEPEPKKSFALATNFYAEVVDTLTGNQSQVSQKTFPFRADGNKLKTTFYYNAEVQGYAEEGYIYVFVMCGGILQPLSVNGSEPELINRVTYKNKKDMYADLEFSLNNASGNRQIIIGYYLSDSVITDDFDVFGDYNETVSYTKFSYELQDGYSLTDKQTPEIYAKEQFDAVYICEADENYETMVNTDIALISDKVPIGQQRERWNLQFKKASSCYGVFHALNGGYTMYLLIDDIPAPIYEGETCINCILGGEGDTLVFDIDIDAIIQDTEQHNAKIMIYDRQTENIKLYPAQIIQKKD